MSNAPQTPRVFFGMGNLLYVSPPLRTHQHFEAVRYTEVQRTCPDAWHDLASHIECSKETQSRASSSVFEDSCEISLRRSVFVLLYLRIMFWSLYILFSDVSEDYTYVHHPRKGLATVSKKIRSSQERDRHAEDPCYVEGTPWQCNRLFRRSASQ